MSYIKHKLSFITTLIEKLEFAHDVLGYLKKSNCILLTCYGSCRIDGKGKHAENQEYGIIIMILNVYCFKTFISMHINKSV